MTQLTTDERLSEIRKRDAGMSELDCDMWPVNRDRRWLLREHERLRTISAELLASLKEMGDWIAAGLQASDEAWPDAKCLQHTEEIAARARAAVDKAEGKEPRRLPVDEPNSTSPAIPASPMGEARMDPNTPCYCYTMQGDNKYCPKHGSVGL